MHATAVTSGRAAGSSGRAAPSSRAAAPRWAAAARPRRVAPRAAPLASPARPAAAPASSSSPVEPDLHPVLEAVNGVTIRITETPALNAFKSWFWGLFAGAYDVDAVQAELAGLIKKHPVIVFAWSFSPFSKNARELLDNLGARYHVVELDRVPGGFALKKELSKMTGRSSVPSIFVRGRHLGGCYDGPGVVPLYRSGELQKVLKAARAL